MILEAKDKSFEDDFVKSIVLLAKEMGWTIDYIMEMDIRKYMVVSQIISEFYDEQKRAMEMSTQKTTFR